jgi:hypothetical protein
VIEQGNLWFSDKYLDPPQRRHLGRLGMTERRRVVVEGSCAVEVGMSSPRLCWM